MNAATHTCECGFTWQHGLSGAHQCEPHYRRTIANLRASLDAAQSVNCCKALEAANQQLVDLRASLVAAQQVVAVGYGYADFLRYIVLNYPADTVIGDPIWHAPRLFKAAQRAIGGNSQQPAPPAEKPAIPEGFAITLVDRSYDQRTKAIIAFNTCAGDLDDKLGAAYLATLTASPPPQADQQGEGT